MCPFLNKVRLFWKEISDSEYNVANIVEAEDNKALRLDIIDDVFTDDPTGQWFFSTRQRVMVCLFRLPLVL